MNNSQGLLCMTQKSKKRKPVLIRSCSGWVSQLGPLTKTQFKCKSQQNGNLLQTTMLYGHFQLDKIVTFKKTRLYTLPKKVT